MAKRVLGNDPFQRGAAQRPADPASPTSEEAPKQPARKAAAKKAPKKKAPKAAAKKASKAAPPHEEPRAAQETRIEDEVVPMREPAGPVVPRPKPPSPVPVMAEEDRTARTEREREVDQVMATLPAAEAAEAAAEAAVDAILAQQPAAEDTLEERAAPSPLIEPPSEQEEGRESEAPEEESDLEELEPSERAMVFAAVGLEAEATGAQPPASVEAEEELPDISRDEFPPGRQAPLSLVPPPSPDAGEGAGEPSDAEPVREEPSTFGARAVGMLSLAREIAGQALASETFGQAMGAAGGLWGALRTGLGTSGSTALDEYGKDSSLVGELQPVLDFLYERYWRVSVQGASHLPRGSCILVANHSGALPFDGLVMHLAISRERPDLREPRWLVEDQVFHAPVLGTLFNRLGAVRACPENALRLLDEQRPVVVFPEGYQGLSKPFAQRYQLKRFGRGGFVKLALRTGAPIVPVAIVGAEESTPLLGRIPAPFLGVPYLPVTPLGPVPLPAKWSIRFGEPIGMEGLSAESADDLSEVQRLTERTRESIQGMLQALLRERRGVFAG